MDPTLIALASAGGTAVVSAMATDGWNTFRSGVVSLWRRFRPDSAVELERELETSRAALLATPDTEAEQVRQALRSAWEGRMLTLFLDDPVAAAEFEALLSKQAGSDSSRANVTFHAEARDHGRVYQTGANQFISER
ncbi:hypothetical protein [Streptomyces marispadix]|uniref:Uncharacterized protein n=1 Tax=Streptomyces marispadix TaxID=2922868 RepID=A0ABS9SZ60_9ACTN|nr:hypothetical protein [Streptomyces marispadix]MCH6161569.1 hypothetical protein [Streptomyces marispadix]